MLLRIKFIFEINKQYEKNILTIILILLVILFGFLLYKTYTIFGIGTLIITNIITFLSTLFLDKLFGSKAEQNSVITYNPKELPKFINVFIVATVGYYLFTKLDYNQLTGFDYYFGLSYLILTTAVPLTYSIIKLIRDRNDFISISDDTLEYRDNDEKGEFKFSTIAKAELNGGILLTFKDGSTITIKTKQMNFNSTDLLGAFTHINAKLPQDNSEEEQKKE